MRLHFCSGGENEHRKGTSKKKPTTKTKEGRNQSPSAEERVLSTFRRLLMENKHLLQIAKNEGRDSRKKRADYTERGSTPRVSTGEDRQDRTALVRPGRQKYPRTRRMNKITRPVEKNVRQKRRESCPYLSTYQRNGPRDIKKSRGDKP